MKSSEKRLEICGQSAVKLRIHDCVCGSEARVVGICTIEYYVRCNGSHQERTGQPCWAGPCSDREYDAIEAWNDVMQKLSEMENFLHPK